MVEASDQAYGYTYDDAADELIAKAAAFDEIMDY
jgi:hypothetical protein